MTEALDKIEKLLETLEEELDTYDQLITDKADKESTYKALKAKAWFEAKGQSDLKTVGDKEAYIDNKLKQEFFEYRLAEGLLESHKERTRTLRAMVNAYQTLSSVGRV